MSFLLGILIGLVAGFFIGAGVVAYKITNTISKNWEW